jgi:hypothetical protein
MIGCAADTLKRLTLHHSLPSFVVVTSDDIDRMAKLQNQTTRRGSKANNYKPSRFQDAYENSSDTKNECKITRIAGSI